jgi:Tol biopolymer transport system component
MGAAITSALLLGSWVAAASAGAASSPRTVLVSRNSAGTQGNGAGNSFLPSISADGRFVAFQSDATNLVPADTNGTSDVFVRDLVTTSTRLVSRNSAGAQGNDGSFDPSISADGRFVAFYSYATNLVPADTNGTSDVFVRDLVTGRTRLVSRNSAGTPGNSASFDPSISADGRFVAFDSIATNLVPADTNGDNDVFVRDLVTGRTRLVSRNSAGTPGNSDSFGPSISADGRFVAFNSYATNLVPADTNGTFDVFVRDLVTGRTRLVSRNSAGAKGNGASFDPSISADGRFVAFDSNATNLVPADTNGDSDVFVRDLVTGRTRLVSRNSAGAKGNGFSYSPSISADGRFVAFYSAATNLVPAETSGGLDVFVRDLVTGRTRLVSRNSAGAPGNYNSYRPSISADGRFVAFDSIATNLVLRDTNGRSDVFVRDLVG